MLLTKCQSAVEWAACTKLRNKLFIHEEAAPNRAAFLYMNTMRDKRERRETLLALSIIDSKKINVLQCPNFLGECELAKIPTSIPVLEYLS